MKETRNIYETVVEEPEERISHEMSRHRRQNNIKKFRYKILWVAFNFDNG
jgi:hypothetical protein